MNVSSFATRYGNDSVNSSRTQPLDVCFSFWGIVSGIVLGKVGTSAGSHARGTPKGPRRRPAMLADRPMATPKRPTQGMSKPHLDCLRERPRVCVWPYWHLTLHDPVRRSSHEAYRRSLSWLADFHINRSRPLVLHVEQTSETRKKQHVSHDGPHHPSQDRFGKSTCHPRAMVRARKSEVYKCVECVGPRSKRTWVGDAIKSKSSWRTADAPPMKGLTQENICKPSGRFDIPSRCDAAKL